MSPVFSSSRRELHLMSGDTLPKTEKQPCPAAGTVSGTAVDSAKYTAHPNLILAICCMSLLIVGMDVTIVNVALPAIQKDLHARLAGLQWILDAYTLVVASFLMLAGSISDRFGRRRVFQIGLGVFTLGSLMCSRAGTIEQLIWFRALQGFGASMLNPVAPSLIANAFPDPKARARAVGIWGAVAGAFAGDRTTDWRGADGDDWMAFDFLDQRANRDHGGSAGGAVRTRVEGGAGAGLRPGGADARADRAGDADVGRHRGATCGLGIGVDPRSICHRRMAFVAFVLYEPRRRDPLLDLRFFLVLPFSKRDGSGADHFSRALRVFFF